MLYYIYMRRLVIREGPLVFLRNVLVMELVAAVLLYFAKFLENYELLYNTWGLENYLDYHLFLMLAFSLFQLAYIMLLFLDWYFSYYEIHEKEIVRRSGLLFRRRKSVNLSDVVSVEVYQSPVSRMIYHATIILEHGNGRVTKIKNIPNFEENLHVVKQSVQSSSSRLRTRDLKLLLEEGEGLFVEFKETLRYDVRKGEVSREMERAVMKTIVGFMNADGGTLVIGVSDDGVVTGLETDYKNLPKKNRDGLENHLNMLVKTMIGLTFAKYVGASFETADGKDVCIVTVRESHKPAYLRNGDKTEEFFVRVGNSTQPFSMSDTEEYIKTHWK
jgi:membrane protein YdbS with pleckstrin-like domain